MSKFDPVYVLVQQRKQKMNQAILNGWARVMCDESVATHRVGTHSGDFNWEWHYFANGGLARAYYNAHVRYGPQFGALQWKHVQYGWTE